VSASPKTLTLLPDRFAVCRLDPAAPIPPWALADAGGFLSVTRTREELSVICSTAALPPSHSGEPDWQCLRIDGVFGLDEPGVLASVIDPLAASGMSVFAVATYDTDYLLVRHADQAAVVLRAAGHKVDLASGRESDGTC
jgi:uncharacterized protein